MLKMLRLPICGLLAVSTFLGAAPTSQAGFDSSLYKSLLKKIYKESDKGDAGDIYVIICHALAKNPDEGEDLVKKLIATLEDNIDRLDEGVSKKDLRQVNKKLKKCLKQHHKDKINPDESRVN